MTDRNFIAVEWGTTRLLARLIGPGGEVADRVVEDVRLADLDHRAQIDRLRQLRVRWPNADHTIWLAGMIGSPLGFASVEQFPCPATLENLANHAHRLQIDELALAILPGLSCTSRFGDPDVLRGEEVAIAGLMDRVASDSILLSLPGMHGKWIEFDASEVIRFHTSMTVELYRTLADRSILAPLMAAPAQDGDAFRTGLMRGAEGGGLARLLFSARTAVITKRFTEAEASSFIWGLVVGADVSENLSTIANRRCFVTGASDIAPLFHAAITHLGMNAELMNNEQLSVAGFAHVRRTIMATAPIGESSK